MSRPLSNKRRIEAGRLVQFLLGQYDKKSLPGDPVFFVHQYKDPRDLEVVAFIASLLAFGNVKAIHASVQRMLTIMGSSPYLFIKTFDPKSHQAAFEGLVHRWVKGNDLSLLLTTLKKVLEHHPSLEAFFLKGYNTHDQDVSPMLIHFAAKIGDYVDLSQAGRGFRYFFPSPADGSPCKRMNMFLRWMIRPADGIDLGLWKSIPPSKLLVPLDTHIYKFARKFGLSRHKNPNWKTARDVTDFLLTLDPEDPVKFDFVICHHGMEVGW